MNAMALPGGLIVLTAVLLDAVKTENEHAFIIGHELGHFKNRDHMRALGRGVVLGILFVAISGSGAGSNYGASIADLALRGFSRSQEASADEFGLGIVHKEFNHVADSWRFFERIDEGELPDLMTYLSTHPSPDDRVDALIMLAGKNGWSITGKLTPLSW
ncbi:MAG: M48 family metallopeptidase [Proteobacteria bacterium]|nr:M48 family metallopeptidase [Pseudomonadota bacterium]